MADVQYFTAHEPQPVVSLVPDVSFLSVVEKRAR